VYEPVDCGVCEANAAVAAVCAEGRAGLVPSLPWMPMRPWQQSILCRTLLSAVRASIHQPRNAFGGAGQAPMIAMERGGRREHHDAHALIIDATLPRQSISCATRLAWRALAKAKPTHYGISIVVAVSTTRRRPTAWRACVTSTRARHRVAAGRACASARSRAVARSWARRMAIRPRGSLTRPHRHEDGVIESVVQ